MNLTRELLLAIACAVLIAGCGPSGSADTEAVVPAKPQRVVSLDYCSDQFLLKLADRDQIVAVSPDATSSFSYMRDTAEGLPTVRPAAENVFRRKPDLVFRAYGGGFNAPRFFQHAGVPVHNLGYVNNFDDVRNNIREAANVLGHPERGEALIVEMDARLEVAIAPPTGADTLYMTPSGVTTGSSGLIHEIISAAGLRNYISEPGWASIPLETIAAKKPAIVVGAFFGDGKPFMSSWSAMRHPVAQRQLSERPTVYLEGAWTACGGWFLVEAVESLAAARKQLAGVTKP